MILRPGRGRSLEWKTAMALRALRAERKDCGHPYAVESDCGYEKTFATLRQARIHQLSLKNLWMEDAIIVDRKTRIRIRIE